MNQILRFIVDGPISSPFQVFDTKLNDYVKGPYKTKAAASSVCARMNKAK